MKQLTIDVGGTFTDCLVLDEAGEDAPSLFGRPEPELGHADSFEGPARLGAVLARGLERLQRRLHQRKLRAGTIEQGRGLRAWPQQVLLI